MLFEMSDAKLCLKNLSDIAPCLMSFRFIKSPMACKMDDEKEKLVVKQSEKRAANIKVETISNQSCLSVKFFSLTAKALLANREFKLKKIYEKRQKICSRYFSTSSNRS